MKIEEMQVPTLYLTEIPALDPVTVHLQDMGPGRGFITINCYGRSWTYFWGAMGDHKIEEFVAGLDSGYLMNKLAYLDKTKQDRAYLGRICDTVIQALRVRAGKVPA